MAEKQVENMPLMLMDAYVVVGKHILYHTDLQKVHEAIVGYFATFYLLDYDYPKQLEVGLHMLHHYVFVKTTTPAKALFNTQPSQYESLQDVSE